MATDSLPEPLRAKLHLEISRYDDREFLKAMLAVCVLCALADDDVSLEERLEIDAILSADPVLQRFDLKNAHDVFDDYLGALRSEPEGARAVLRERVERLGATSPKQARTAMRAAWLVVAADGAITMREDAMFCHLCGLAGLDADIVRRGVELI